VVIATSGDEALAVLDGFLPDLIVFPVFLAPGDESKLQVRLEALLSPGDRRALTIPLGAFFDGESHATRPTAVPPRWFYWFKPQALEPEMADPQRFADAVRADVHRPRATRTSVSADVEPSPLQRPTPVVHPAPAHAGSPSLASTRQDAQAAFRAPGDALESAAAMVSERVGESAALRAGQVGGEAGEPFAAESTDEDRSDRGARAAAFVAALGTAFRAMSRIVETVGSVLGAVWRVSRGLPRPVQVGVPAVAVLLTLGVTGQVGRLIGSPVRWATAARERWFPAKPPSGIAEIQTVPEGAQVWYQGRQLGVTPLRTELAVGSHEVELSYRNTTRTLTLDVTPGNTIVQRIEWAAPRVAGALRVESDPPGAAVAVDGKPRGVTPLTVEDLTAGQHDVDIVMNGNTVRETVDVRGGKTVTLRPSIYRGWLALFSPIDLTVAVDGRAVALDDQHRALLPSGSHQLTGQNRSLGYEYSQTSEIKPGDTTPVSVVLPKTTLSITTSSPAEVWIDGERIGDAPITDYPVDIGTRSVLARSAEHGERHTSVTATVNPAHVSFNFASAAP